MSIQHRSVLGKPNQLDNGLKPASAVDGGNPSPSGVTDQSSPETEQRRNSLELAYREARNAAGAFDGDGAAGVQIGRGPDTFSQHGPVAGGGTGDVVAPDALVTRDGGADDPRGSAYGNPVG